jgi:hypothetical protein
MRLLKVDSPELELVEFFGNRIPEYAILSHTWGDDEVLYGDLHTGNYRHKEGYKKILYTCDQARKDSVRWCWVDTCCIDKTSSAELSEAINSMFNWYNRAYICYAYLADVHKGISSDIGEVKLPQCDMDRTDVVLIRDQYDSDPRPPQTVNKDIPDSRWFERGWTLQELIAPFLLRFYDSSWRYLGDRDEELLHLVCDRTGLTSDILGNPAKLRYIPVARRMSWVARRQTTRKEDMAYCMLGIFGVNMPLLYGEEENAFVRLQEEIAKKSDDHSLFVFSSSHSVVPIVRQMLATSPSDFAMCSNLEPCDMLQDRFSSEPYHLTSDGLHISLPLIQPEDCDGRVELAVLNYKIDGSPVGLVLHRFKEKSRLDVRYIGSTYGVLMQGMVKSLPLGTGLVLIHREIAVTAVKTTIVIRGDEHWGRNFRPFSFNAWLRYDSALQYELASPGCVAQDTVAKQRGARPTHMICVDAITDASSGAVLKFSAYGRDSPAIVVAFTYKISGTHVAEARAALLVADTDIHILRAETEDQLLTLGTGLLAGSMYKTIAGLPTRERIASTILNGREMLELWHELDSPDGISIQSLLTLRVRRSRSSMKGKAVFCDGTQDCYGSGDESP